MALPQAINDQDHLLTVQVKDEDMLKHPTESYSLQPLFLDRENGTWVLYGKFEPGTRLPRHFHTGTVHFFTTKGEWYYEEYPDEKQVAGSYLYEPGGSIHRFCVSPDAAEAAEGFMVVSGSNINYDDDGDVVDMTDAATLEMAMRAASQLYGRPMPTFIKPGGEANYAN